MFFRKVSDEIGIKITPECVINKLTKTEDELLVLMRQRALLISKKYELMALMFRPLECIEKETELEYDETVKKIRSLTKLILIKIKERDLLRSI